ncbi:putative murein hydrolase export regulator [Fictibacillus macauensis ZFHKF-1]|uniref:Putative murein hydrolase export regulator n=1 Tax=Fictibacillus macauensis ZFHKF-1 TaxID=1196324 RepID=I8UFC9_9BACL|nr:LrgB family protein [Fictibacillus macauensis]EIT85508.1 putative murein hydrolase export regulator [Fictibacillus macauensis ZFHKF-1]
MSSFLFIVVTVFVYLVMKALYQRWSNPVLIPVITATAAIIAILLVFHIPYHDYMQGGKWIQKLLGPGVVALAYPLYNYRSKLKKHVVSIIIGVFTGTITGILTILLFGQMLGVARPLLISLLPKSITTPVAMEVARLTGGLPALTSVFVIVAGISGAVFAPLWFKWLRLQTPLARGLGIGTSSHAIGTSKAMEFGEETAAFSSVAMGLSCIIASLIVPVVVLLCL